MYVQINIHLSILVYNININNIHIYLKGYKMDKLDLIALDNGIENTADSYGKTLLLQAILNSMSEEEANTFMNDTLMMLDDEEEAYEIREVA